MYLWRVTKLADLAGESGGLAAGPELLPADLREAAVGGACD